MQSLSVCRGDSAHPALCCGIYVHDALFLSIPMVVPFEARPVSGFSREPAWGRGKER